MRQYNIYQHPLGDIQAVKIGWSWPGFLWCILWPLIKRMWGRGLVLFVLSFVFAFLVQILPIPEIAATCLVLQLALQVVVGVNGNEWVCAALQARGYEFRTGSLPAANKEGAVALFLRMRVGELTEKQGRASAPPRRVHEAGKYIMKITLHSGWRGA